MDRKVYIEKALAVDMKTYERAQDAVPRTLSQRFRDLMVVDYKTDPFNWKVAVGLGVVRDTWIWARQKKEAV